MSRWAGTRYAALLLLTLFVGLGIPLSAHVVGVMQAVVNIGDSFYNPQEVTIVVGATVLWKNNGTLIHTSTSDTGLWDSGNIPSGGSYQSPVFTSVGVFRYHSSGETSPMTGKVIVVPASALTLSPASLNEGLLTGYVIAILFAIIVIAWLNYPSSRGRMKTRAR